MRFFTHTFIFLAAALAAMPVFASPTDGTIVDGGIEGYAWGSEIGWVNFAGGDTNIHITDGGLTGYAWSENFGWINLNPTQGGVKVAPNGDLSGHAWGEGLGWIDFSGARINEDGKFVGTADGDNLGTLTFNCTRCSVRTDYRPEEFRDTDESGSSSGGSSSTRPPESEDGGETVVPPPQPPLPVVPPDKTPTIIAEPTTPATNFPGDPTKPGVDTGTDEVDTLISVNLATPLPPKIIGSTLDTSVEIDVVSDVEDLRIKTLVVLTNSNGETVYKNERTAVVVPGYGVTVPVLAGNLVPGMYTLAVYTLTSDGVQETERYVFAMVAGESASVPGENAASCVASEYKLFGTISIPLNPFLNSCGCYNILSLCFLWWILIVIIVIAFIVWRIIRKRNQHEYAEQKMTYIPPTQPEQQATDKTKENAIDDLL